MKTLVLSLIISLLVVALAACDSVRAEEDVFIPDGVYGEFGMRIAVDDSIYMQGLARVYFQRIFKFENNDSLEITVHSDFHPEQGKAHAHWQTEGGALRITIEETTTSYYESGEKIIYEDVKVLDAQYQTVFTIDTSEVVFQGPGLILSQESTDESDLDRDGNTEELRKESYYFFLYEDTKKSLRRAIGMSTPQAVRQPLNQQP